MLGSSEKIYDEEIQSLISLLQPTSVLELGCGSGKLLNLCSVLRNKTTAVQKIFTEDDLLRLRAIGYDVIDRDILDYYKEGFDERYDLVVAMDVIEHFLFSDAISIIDFSLYRSNWMLLVWPSQHPQDGASSSFDRHRTSFTLRALTDRFEVVFYRQCGFGQYNFLGLYHCALLRGHMNLGNFS